VSHRVLPVSTERKADLLTHVLTLPPTSQALVFCKTKRGSDRVGERLERAGLSVSVIHGNKSQGARTRALGDFKSGRARILVATDIAARGLDIAELPLVVNYDLPMVAEDYIHRVGRTGRAGLTGRALRKYVAAALGTLPELGEWIDPHLLQKEGWPGFRVAMETLHRPTLYDPASFATARKRLAYDEALAREIAMGQARLARERQKSASISKAPSVERLIVEALPFKPTKAQRTAYADISADLARSILA